MKDKQKLLQASREGHASLVYFLNKNEDSYPGLSQLVRDNDSDIARTITSYLKTPTEPNKDFDYPGRFESNFKGDNYLDNLKRHLEEFSRKRDSLSSLSGFLKQDISDRPANLYQGDSKIDKELKTVSQLQVRLAGLFHKADSNQITLLDLYDEGGEIEDKITEAMPKFWDRKNFAMLKSALIFAHNLHDRSARKKSGELNYFNQNL